MDDPESLLGRGPVFFQVGELLNLLVFLADHRFQNFKIRLLSASLLAHALQSEEESLLRGLTYIQQGEAAQVGLPDHFGLGASSLWEGPGSGC